MSAAFGIAGFYFGTFSDFGLSLHCTQEEYGKLFCQHEQLTNAQTSSQTHVIVIRSAREHGTQLSTMAIRHDWKVPIPPQW